MYHGYIDLMKELQCALRHLQQPVPGPTGKVSTCRPATALQLIWLWHDSYPCRQVLETLRIRLPRSHSLRGREIRANKHFRIHVSLQSVSSVAQSCTTLSDPMNHSTPGLPVHHQLPESTQTHVHWGGDAIQPSHPLSSPSPPALNLSQHQGLFKWVISLHQVAKVLDFQLQHRSFHWIPRTDLL